LWPATDEACDHGGSETARENDMTGVITLTVQNGSLAGRQYAFTGRRLCLVGRAEDCEIRLPGGPEFIDVSRHHCLLEIDPPHLSVRDLGSCNGTRVNGMLVGRADDPHQQPGPRFDPATSFSLSEGDEVQVGKTVFRVGGAVPADSPPLLTGGGKVPAAGEREPVVIGEEDLVAGRRIGRARPGLLGHRVLDDVTAAELMTPNVVSVPASATLAEAEALLVERGLSAVPVLGEDGEPVGVLSRTDIVAHDCEENGHPVPCPTHPDGAADTAPAACSRVLRIEGVGPARVQDVMTQVVFSVAPETSAARVVDALLALKVHRLFVTDTGGHIRGVVSMTDVLRHLHQSPEMAVR
jgi:CBS domain-containing protein